MTDDEITLQNNVKWNIVRFGDTVPRPTHPWSSSIHLLLNHLESGGFAYSPRFCGLDDRGREVLLYIEGESGKEGWAKVADEVALHHDGQPGAVDPTVIVQAGHHVGVAREALVGTPSGRHPTSNQFSVRRQ